jgi:hypothetical protein
MGERGRLEWGDKWAYALHFNVPAGVNHNTAEVKDIRKGPKKQETRLKAERGT